MGITCCNKEVFPEKIAPGGTANVRLTLTACPDGPCPRDVVLLLDRSASMRGKPLECLKTAVHTFAESLRGGNGRLKEGLRAGLVSFARQASADAPLSCRAQPLNAAADALTAGGMTDHRAAFEAAVRMLQSQSRAPWQTVILFSDGACTAGADPDPCADLLKVCGAEIFCVGIVRPGCGVSENLRRWASLPTEKHLFLAEDWEGLESIFEGLARGMQGTGATGICLQDAVSPCFEVTEITPPEQGTACRRNDREICWKIDELGREKCETAQLTFGIRERGGCCGTFPVSESLCCCDCQHHPVRFPDPKITVCCEDGYCAEKCPPVEIETDPCCRCITADAGETELCSAGRILELQATVKCVCPERRVALGVILSETDDCGGERCLGVKALTLPAHHGEGCRDIKVRCIRFVLPEEGCGLCRKRKISARLIAHYIGGESIPCTAQCE